MILRFGGTGSNESKGDFGLISEMRGYWEALRDDGALPDRHKIDPRGIAGVLEHSFLVERIGAGLARFRIAGMAFHDLCGMDVRGMPVSCLVAGEARPRLQVELERMFHGPAILTLRLQALRGLGQPALSARMIFLPVKGHGTDGALALGCIETTGEIGRSARRFAVEDSRIEHVGPLPRPNLAGKVPSTPERPVRAPAGRGHLRLVDLGN